MSSWLSRLFGKKDQPETREESVRIPTPNTGKQAEVPLAPPSDTSEEIPEVEIPAAEPVEEQVEVPSAIETVESVLIPEAEAPIAETVEAPEEVIAEPISEPETIPEPESFVEPVAQIEEAVEAAPLSVETTEETAEAVTEPDIAPEEGEVITPASEPVTSSVYLHPPFSEEVQNSLGLLQETFQEVFPMSLQQWENGFRLDQNPDHEIAVWLHSAEIYRRFTTDADPVTKRNVFAVLTACMSYPAEKVPNVLPAHLLKTDQIQAVLDAYYEASTS